MNPLVAMTRRALFFNRMRGFYSRFPDYFVIKLREKKKKNSVVLL